MMDFSPLEKSENLGHLMVKLHDVYNEYKQDIFGTVFSQNRISDVVEEILTEENVTEEEQELVTEILLTLVKEAEAKLKAAISDRISVIDDAPNRLSLELAHDDITVARPILENSVALSDDDLVYIINTRQREHWQSIARRRGLKDGVINKLADTNDSSTYNELLKNFNVRLTHYTGEKIAERAKTDHFLADGLIGRDELSKSIIIDIYHHVGEAIQHQIEQKYNYTSEELNKAINDISAEISSGETLKVDKFTDEAAPPRRPEPMPHGRDMDFDPEAVNIEDEEYATALKYKKSGELSVDLMVRHLKRKQFKSFIAQLAVMADLDPSLVRDILRQQYGKGLAIICVSQEINKSDFMNLFLLTQPLRGSGRIVPDGHIAKAMDSYSNISLEQAKKIVENKFLAN